MHAEASFVLPEFVRMFATGLPLSRGRGSQGLHLHSPNGLVSAVWSSWKAPCCADRIGAALVPPLHQAPSPLTAFTGDLKDNGVDLILSD